MGVGRQSGVRQERVTSAKPGNPWQMLLILVRIQMPQDMTVLVTANLKRESTA